MPTRVRHGPQLKHGFVLCLLPPILVFLLPSASLSLPLGPVQAAAAPDQLDERDGDGGQVMSGDRRDPLSYLERTLRALEKVEHFFNSTVTRVNLDGVIGIRMVEGTLKVLLRNLIRRGQLRLLPQELVQRIWALYEGAKQIGNRAQPNVAVNEPSYYHHIWPTISENMWVLNYPTRNLLAAPTWPYEDVESMDEEESDDCLAELFGTTGKTDKKCVITDNCWSKMTPQGYHRYSLTHQIFYLQLGQLSGCTKQMQQKIQESQGKQSGGLLELQNMFCVNILGEAKDLVRRGYPMNKRDLFLEQAGLCGMYGFREFFHYSWLDHILAWQNQELGCYNNKNWPQYLEGKEHFRRKREEHRLSKDCLAHLTALAGLVLSQYVRFLTEAILPPPVIGHRTVRQRVSVVRVTSDRVWI